MGDIEQALEGTEVAGTIVGRVVRLGGNSDGCLATDDHGTGRISLWCPAVTCLWGPADSKVFEFDIVGTGGSAHEGLSD